MGLDLVGLGSAIIDFAPADVGIPLSEVRSFVPSAGGAVANLLVAASRLGLRTGFLGCVGYDEFGAFILRDFEREGVDISCVKRVKKDAQPTSWVEKRLERRMPYGSRTADWNKDT